MIHADTYRLAAMYDSLEEFAAAQPYSFEEARQRGEYKHLKSAFTRGYISEYREGGKEVCGDRYDKVDKRRKGYKEVVRGKAPPLNIHTSHILRTARGFPDENSFAAAQPQMMSMLIGRGHEEALARFFTRKFSISEIYEEAWGHATWEDFVEARPRYAQEAERLGITDHLRDGPGAFSVRVSVWLEENKELYDDCEH